MAPARSGCRNPQRAHDFIARVVAVTALWAGLVPTPVSATSLTLAPEQPRQDSTIAKEGPNTAITPILQTDSSLLHRTDSTPVHIIVKLGYDPVASYDGDIAGFAATNPKKTGKKLKENRTAVDAYLRYIAAYETEVLDRIKAKIPSAKIGQSFRTAYGGVAMTLPANQVDALLAIEGVVAVQKDSTEQPTAVRIR